MCMFVYVSSDKLLVSRSGTKEWDRQEDYIDFRKYPSYI